MSSDGTPDLLRRSKVLLRTPALMLIPNAQGGPCRRMHPLPTGPTRSESPRGRCRPSPSGVKYSRSEAARLPVEGRVHPTSRQGTGRLHCAAASNRRFQPEPQNQDLLRSQEEHQASFHQGQEAKLKPRMPEGATGATAEAIPPGEAAAPSGGSHQQRLGGPLRCVGKASSTRPWGCGSCWMMQRK